MGFVAADLEGHAKHMFARLMARGDEDAKSKVASGAN
jgi:hypothetical protein